MNRLVLLFSLLLITSALRAQKTSFFEEAHPEAPDYSLAENWSALPFRDDTADELPKGESWISDSLKTVDVFYVHPTMYQKGPLWNAGLDMKKINRKVDRLPVRLQASVFNKACRVYAPRYRQAVVGVFYDKSEDGDRALDLAYQDVKRAFQYFLDNYSKGRPFIIAGHSQGTHHTRRLLQEMIDTTELKERMVAAYVIGFSVNDSMYQNLHMCQDATETGCYLSWMSYKEGFEPSGWWFENTQSVNPLTWNSDTALVFIPNYEGTVVLNPKRKFYRKMSVRVKQLDGQILWVKTKAPWFSMMKSLHIADYGLFYHSIRENISTRIDAYQRGK
ncbi:MAG: DUF3089 domain-containing protein [Flavobacteriales bacterium]|nr:DUF3089 domain-containing protein [Flavobacteriales bacterium]MCB9190528.1 DUF3089 domain-containing protein [Flavobacteriales bacterium]